MKRSREYRQWLERQRFCAAAKRECIRGLTRYIEQVAEQAFNRGYAIAAKHAKDLK